MIRANGIRRFAGRVGIRGLDDNGIVPGIHITVRNAYIPATIDPDPVGVRAEAMPAHRETVYGDRVAIKDMVTDGLILVPSSRIDLWLSTATAHPRAVPRSMRLLTRVLGSFHCVQTYARTGNAEA